MPGIEEWSRIAHYDDDERIIKDIRDKEIELAIIKSKIQELVEEQSSQHISAICPMQLMSMMNERLSKESNLFGQVLYIKGIYM